MNPNADSVTIITLTRQRCKLLRRAIASVAAQDFDGPLRHLILIDDCMVTQRWCARHAEDLGFDWHFVPRSGRAVPIPQHLAHLRNQGVRLAASRWIMFLDDDNELERNHVSSLVSLARKSGSKAVHSYAQLFWRNGSPYLEDSMPWGPRLSSRKTYQKLCGLGVFIPGSHVVRDQAASGTVDTGEWLLDRELLIRMPFPVRYTSADLSKQTTEDTKLLRRLMRKGTRIRCTELPTLKYYLGGYSNQRCKPRLSGLAEKSRNP
jgi:glycosyltransferase involved in cell wall biosynthesis